MKSKPNFLIFITDQYNPKCTGYAGHPVVKTPNLDSLARSGVNFSRMYSSQPLCMPARATLFTGLNPRGHRVRMNGIPLDKSVPTFTGALSDAGYRTHCCGKIHLHCSGVPNGMKGDDLNPFDSPESGYLWRNGIIKDLPLPYYGLDSVDFCSGHGHDTFGHYLNWLKEEHPEQVKLFLERTTLEKPSAAAGFFNRSSYKWALPAEYHPMTWINDRTIDFLDDARLREDPFMLMCSIQEPHSPFAPPAPYCNRYSPDDVPDVPFNSKEFDNLPPHFRKMYETSITTSGHKNQPMAETEPYRKECTAHYYGLIEMIDDQVGRVMAALKKNKLDKNTIVMFIADHGQALGDHGMWGKGPYHFDSVIRVPFLVSCPELFDGNRKYDEPVEMVDFAPTILDLAGVDIPEGSVPPESEAENAPPAWPGKSLVPLLNGSCEGALEEKEALVEMDEDYLGFKLRTLVTKRYRLTVYSGKEYGELFDLETDPDELVNLWGLNEWRGVRDSLRLKLLDKIIRTDISVPRQLSRA